MTSENASSSINNVLLSFIAIVFCILAINAFWAFDYKRTALDNAVGGGEERIVKPSLLISEGTIQKRILDNNVARLSAPLEFMVWPHERKMASIKLQAVLQQRINLDPFDAQVWRHLSFTQSYIQTPIEERIWTIATGVKLGGWQTSERLLFTRHCIAENESFELILPEFCRRLIEALPNDIPTSRLARDMGVKHNYLKWLLLHNKDQAENDLEQSDRTEKASQ